MIPPKLDISLLQEITENFCGIYICLCLVSGKYYLGSCEDFKSRQSGHLCLLRKKNHHSNHFQQSWNKYSEANFIWLKIRDCKKENLKAIEQFYLNIYMPWKDSIGLNINDKSCGGQKIVSEETKEKLRKANLGKKLSEETKNKMSKSKLGRKHSEESKRKMSKIQKKSSKSRNFTHSEESKDRISKSLTGRKLPNRNQKGKNSPNFGKKLSKDAKAKISLANKGRVKTIEEKEKRRLTMRKSAIKNQNYYFVKISTAQTIHCHFLQDLVELFGGRKNSYSDLWHKHGGRRTHNDFRRATENEIQEYIKGETNATKI